MSTYQHIKTFRQKLKSNLVYVLGDKCAICNYNKCITALELHHLNSEDKEFTFGSNANIATEIALNEAKKCILVCANCHREIHANLIDSSSLKSTYSEQRAQEVLEILHKHKTKNKVFCQDCGVEISESRAVRCIACANKARQKCERPSREELKKLIRIKTFVSLGQDYGVSDKAISKWCKSMNLPPTKTLIKSYSDEEWEQI